MDHDSCDAIGVCERLAKTYYENFTVTSLLLPRALRQPMRVVYAYCRTADDLGDEIGDSQQSLTLLQKWEDDLRRAIDGETVQNPVLRATAGVIRRYHLPQELFFDLLIAFRRDQTVTRYNTTAELLDYCRYSANPVGRIVLALGASVDNSNNNKTTAEMLEWSDAICTGLQLINHWQDVSRDLAQGRCYIPQEVAERFSYSLPESLEAIHASPVQANTAQRTAFREMMQFLVDDAAARLESGRPLIAAVPQMLRVDIALFLLGGLATARVVRRRIDSLWQHRPTISRWKQLFVLLPQAIWITRKTFKAPR